jgi:NADH-quinone oxidoreductase subunit G
MMKQISLLIDHIALSAPENTLIVDAAKRAGIDIPVFCYHPKMKPVGMCRVCLVEVGRPMIDRSTGKPVTEPDGSPKIQFGPKLETACTTPISEGMVVHTNSEKVTAARSEILEFLLTSHPLDCPVCDKGGECPLQNLTQRYGPAESRFRLEDKQHLAKNVPLGELIYLDRERCIQCGRCVRFQAEEAGDPVIGFYQRGRSIQIITCSEPGFDSIFSGNTIDICPVGALTSVDFRFGARPWELKSRESLCTHCPVGCNLSVDIRREARSGGDVVVKRIMPRQNEAVNGIWICDKGRFAHHFTDPKNRILKPLVRKANTLAPTSLDTALDTIATNLRRKNTKLVTLAGGRLANEDLFNLKQLTNTVNGKMVQYASMAGGELTLQAGLTQDTQLEDMEQGNVILVVACDLHEEAPIYWLRVKQAVERGATLIMMNAHETRLDSIATHIVRYQYGEESLSIDRLMKGGDPAARAIKKTQGLVVFVGSDGLGVKDSQAVMESAARLLSKAGLSGKQGSGLVAVWQSANIQGAWEMGCGITNDLEKTIRGTDTLIIAGADPLRDFPGLEDALQSVKFLAVFELTRTATAELADVVIPVQAFTEREGTFTSAERRVQAFHKAIDPHPGLLPDYAVAALLGQRIGLALAASVPEIFAQIARVIPTFKGLTYEDTGRVSDQWPVVGGNNKYFSGTVAANSMGLGIRLPLVASAGKASFKAERQPAYDKKKLWAVPITRLYDIGNTLISSKLLEKRMAQYEIRVHPDTAKTIGIQAGAVLLSLGKTKQPVNCIIDKSAPTGFALIPRSAGIPIDKVTETKLVMASDANQSKRNR